LPFFKTKNNKEDDGVIDLNVGGMLYSTTHTTLLHCNSMLTAMFSGRHELKRRADGRVFINRDGELFKYILQYLRDSDLNVAYLNKGLRERLKRKAAFYCLPGLEKKLMTNSHLPSTVVLRIGLCPLHHMAGMGNHQVQRQPSPSGGANL